MVLPAPAGQDLMTSKPAWGGRGGGPQAAADYAWDEFTQLFGRNPTQAELAQLSPYFQGTDPNIANVAGGNQAVSSYFQQQQAVANAPQQEADAISKQIPIIQNLINSQTQSTASDITNPNSPTYQAMAGNLNNLGITPSSGAFQGALGATLGTNASNAINAAIGSVGLPLASTYAGGAAAPFTSAMEQPNQLFQNNLQLQDFLQQMTAGQNIAKANAPSDFQKYGMPLLAPAVQGGSQAGASAAIGATWICTAMKRAGVMTEHEIARLHDHLFKAFWKKPFSFIKYWLFGRFLVYLCERKGTCWSAWKPAFYDDVISEKDPVKAVELYEEAFWQLFKVVRDSGRREYALR